MTECMEQGCERRASCRGVCSMHYQRLWKLGKINDLPRTYTKRLPHCTVEGCLGKIRSQGLCRHHWYIAHKDEVREYAIEHRERRAEIGRRRRAYFREYHKLHPEKVRAWSHKRRELKTSGVPHTGADEIHVYNLAEGKCSYCGIKLSFKEGQIDHIVPLSRGGSNDIGNLAWSCPHCNNKKNAKFIIEVKYAQKRTKMSQ